MTKYTTASTFFVNPYNFVSLDTKCYKIIDYRKKKKEGNLTGWIDCSIKTLTPVFIPNTSSVRENEKGEQYSDVFGAKTENGKPVNSYDFFSYANLKDEKNPHEPKPVIPGSEIRGMIRSAFEAVTNSCLSAIDDERKLYKRVTSPAKPGRLVLENNRWKIIGCKKYRLPQKWIKRENEKIFINNVEYKEGETVFVKINYNNFKIIKIDKKGFRKGFLHIGEYNENKKYESVFIPTGKTVPIDSDAVKNLIDNLKLYQDKTVNLHYKEGKHKGYKHIGNAEKLKPEDLNGALIYFVRHGEKYYLSPAAIGREIFYNKLIDIIGSFKPCKKLDELCQACALFGLAGKEDAAASRVRFMDALSETYEFYRPKTLKELSSPKLSATEFYLKKTYQGPDLWNYDYAGNWRARGKKLQDIMGYTPEIRGRKFYWHQKNPKPFIEDKSLISERNVHVRPLKAGAEFKFKVYFNDITKDELNKLLWVLEIGGREENAHKTGMGKPIGMGSVRIYAHTVNIRNIRIENGTVKYEMEKYKKPNYEEIKNILIRSEILEEFLKITNFQNAHENVTYPINEHSDKVYEWFIANKQIKGTGTSPVINRTLPKIKEPFLQKYIDVKKKNEDIEMQIKSMIIKNFRVFKDAYVENLGKMNVFLGVNGSGKSTLFDLFAFLSDALLHNMTIAVNKRGGFPEVLARGCQKEDTIFLEIEFKGIREETFIYTLEIAFQSGKTLIKNEILKYVSEKDEAPFNILDFHNGRGTILIDGNSREKIENETASPDILAIKGFGQFERFKAVSLFRELLEKWYISNFSIEYGRSISDTGIAQHLSPTGDNLAQVTKYIYENHRGIFESILEKLPLRIPGIKKVEATETEDGRIVLRFKDENFNDPFVARYVSDGTIKMFAYMILLHDPEPHPLLCIEEPENYLHPDLLPELCEEIRGYAERGGQIFVSTHSPDFINGVSLEELYFLEKRKGFTQVKAVRDDPLVRELAKENNSLGWLWRNHYIYGANVK